jgi:hypothetical protein
VNDVRLFERHFTNVRHRCFWLFTLWIFVRFYFIERVHPSKERYWKKIVAEHERLTAIYRRWKRLDDLVLRAAPFLRRYCWTIAICARKPVSGSAPAGR